MKNIIYPLLFLFILTSCDEPKYTFDNTFINDIGQRLNNSDSLPVSGVLYMFDEIDSLNIEITLKDGYQVYFKSFYQNGQLESRAKTKNSIPIGLVESFYKNGQENTSVNYNLNGQKDGLSTNYFENGNINFVETYKNGKLNGIEKRYNGNGYLQYIATNLDGKLNGPYKEYFENGNIKEEGSYSVFENRYGIWKDYFINGKLKNRLLYKNGILVMCVDIDGYEIECVE